MTTEQTFPYYRSPAAIRNEEFSHRVRGLDEQEVREYLALLADQVQASELERSGLQAENDKLRAENETLRAEAGELRRAAADDTINPQAVLLFSQAQQVADQLVEEAVIHARDLMTSARNQQREILEQAHRAAEAAAHQAAQANGRDLVASAAPASTGSSDTYQQPVPEIEYVRTFARVAQVQLRSVIDALTEEVDKLGELPRLEEEGRSWVAQQTTRVVAQRDWRIEPLPPRSDNDRR